jgi:hypothetical protein
MVLKEFGAWFVPWIVHLQNHLPMLIKLNSIFHSYARHRVERVESALTRQQWIVADRILMILLFISVITLAIAFS